MRTFFLYLRYKVFTFNGNNRWLITTLYLLIALFCLFVLYQLLKATPESLAEQLQQQSAYNKQRAELEQQFMFKYDSLPGEFDIYRCNPTTQRIENIYLDALVVVHTPKNSQHCITKEF